MLAFALLLAAEDGRQLANKADVLKYELTGMQAVAVHTVTDTAGKRERQIYTVLNQIGPGASFIVISSENAEVNGMVYLIKGDTLYAAAPSQRTFSRLGGLNLDRRISGSLFSHWDLQGNIPLGNEYDATITRKDGADIHLTLAGKKGSHYAKMEAVLDAKTGLFKSTTCYDQKGSLKTATFSKVRMMGGKVKRKMPTLVEMKRADGRSDLSVPQTTFRLYEVELNPDVNYDDVMAVSDGNLQKLRSKYVVSGERFRSILAEADD